MAFTDYDKCSLLLPMDGSNGGTTAEDWSVNKLTPTFYGTAQTSTANSIYYGSSLLLPGTSSSYLTVPVSSATQLGTNDFTIMSRFYLTSYSSSYGGLYAAALLSTYFQGSSSPTGWQLRINGTSTSYDAVNLYTGTTDLNFSYSFSLNTWYHIAVTRISGIIYIFVNYVLISSVANTDNFTGNPVDSRPLYIGRLNDATYIFPAAGNLQDVAIFNGSGLWSTDFADPGRLIGELSGTVYDSTGTEAARTIIAVPRSYPTKVYTTTSSAVDGTYSLRVPATEVTRVALADDAAEGATYNDIVDRIIPE